MPGPAKFSNFTDNKALPEGRIHPRPACAFLSQTDTSVPPRASGWHLFFFVMICAVLGARFAYSDDQYLKFFTDDFFFYLKIAINIVDHHRSSFDLIHDTNGYHPLWLALIAGYYYVFGNTIALFYAITVTIALICLATLRFLFRISYFYTRNTVLSHATSLFSAIFMVTITRTGMEISLALLFMAALIDRLLHKPLATQTRWQATGTGFLVSLLFLARIDSIVFPALYLALSILTESQGRRKSFANLFFLVLGAFLIPIYLLFNLTIFHVLLPISGMAKQLKTDFFPSVNGIARLYSADPFNVLFVWPTCGAAAIFIILSFRNSFRCRCRWHAFILTSAVILHPIVFYFVLAVRSDWWIWTWYLYPLVMVSAVVPPQLLAILSHRVSRFAVDKIALAASVLIAATALVGILSVNKVNKTAEEIYRAAKRIQAFSNAHPGPFAMGDRAATAAYLLSVPLVQLEGLVGDKEMLENIRKERNLNDVLHEQHIKYYAVTDPHRQGNCVVAAEPKQAGPSSPKMKGVFCRSPVEDFWIAQHETVIFALSENGAGD